VADTRSCEQCGVVFEPRREHARFCSARCRVAWNREHAGDQAGGDSALAWSVAAMRETAQRLAAARPADRAQGFAVVSDAVWWVTMVDATLVRYHPGAYDRVLAGLGRAGRELTEGTLAGLRFVRNRMGYHEDYADFVRPPAGAGGPPDAGVAAWTWKPLPEPALGPLPPRGRAWERARYRAYQDCLAGHRVGETFERAAEFLTLASAGPPGRATAAQAVREP
jgi:hypothetical protein